MSTNTEKESVKKENKLVKFLLKYKKIVAFILIVAAIVAYYNFELYQTKNQFTKEKENLIVKYTETIDSLKLSNTKEVITVFSWAVRSELLRENIEQVNTLFNTFVKIPQVTSVSLIDNETKLIKLSTDKKSENELFDKLEMLKINELTIVDKNYYVPISGLNKQLGLLKVTIE